ncbi:hydrogenase expression protein HypE [Rhodopila sp.]|jgi:Ni,Fe-hydrogenase III large subunit|uniref:hydrogenase large subunit n=1 Tax=Rhodopila sp. TaxID=2480087 RepID=UPI002B92BDDD|nr:hydrogenase expression protein HypE [Rhodopila sp.]HVZ09008.1 hydrogenase expression protein HypE [Rhodopila sp.]
MPDPSTTPTTPLATLLSAGAPVPAHRPWPRAVVDAGIWQTAALQAAQGALTLLSLWAETGMVHMALFDAKTRSAAVLSLDCPDGHFPSVGALHPPAIRLERTIRDLFGIAPVGLTDNRPWLDHGRWGEETRPAAAYAFLPVNGGALHQVPVGPVHAGIIEPGHFRFTCDGETVVRLEQRLGYVHKGIDRLMTDAPPNRAAALAGRVSGDSTVAYALAFALAVEAATGTEPPPRAIALRAVMAELERIANHIGDFGAICNDAAFSLMLAHCGVLRERVLRASASCFGHRLMMDRILPGGVAADPDGAGLGAVRDVLAEVAVALPPLVTLYDTTTSLQDRTVGTGHVRPDLAARFGAGGYVGRASGRDFDARRDLAYAPYADLALEVPVLPEGDVNARVWVRLKEIDQSLRLIATLLDTLPAGPVSVPLAAASGEGMALAEAFRGDVLAWLRLEDGLVRRCHLRDASWFQWPLLEAAIEGNIVADFPLCNKSFNCSYSGHDL